MSPLNDSVKLVKRIDFSLKTLLIIGIIIIAFLFFNHPTLIFVFIILGIILLGGFYLPRHIGWKIRENRALKAKNQELEKWGFASRDREGPWINYVEYPVVANTPCADGKYFYSDWLVIENGYIVVNPGPSIINHGAKSVTYNLQRTSTYAWDGCTPKRWFYWFALIGTPDWWHREHQISILNKDLRITEKTVFWQIAQHASLIHDALYQYMDNMPIAKEEVDELFYQMLLQAKLPLPIANLYLFAVTKFGANDLPPPATQTVLNLTCDSFKHLTEYSKGDLPTS